MKLVPINAAWDQTHILNVLNSVPLVPIFVRYVPGFVCAATWLFAKKFVRFAPKSVMPVLRNAINMMKNSVKRALKLAVHVLRLAGNAVNDLNRFCSLVPCNSHRSACSQVKKYPRVIRPPLTLMPSK